MDKIPCSSCKCRDSECKRCGRKCYLNEQDNMKLGIKKVVLGVFFHRTLRNLPSRNVFSSVVERKRISYMNRQIIINKTVPMNRSPPDRTENLDLIQNYVYGISCKGIDNPLRFARTMDKSSGAFNNQLTDHNIDQHRY